MVPSKQVSEYLDEIGYKFTDSQRATLIWNAAGCGRAEKLSALEDLSLNTEDSLLMQQIKDRLRFELMMLADFKENSDGEFIYVVEDKDNIQIGYFDKASMAMRFAADRKDKCRILKQLIVKGNKLPLLSEYKDLYHKFINSDVKEQDVGEYLELAVAGVEIDEKGNVADLWCDKNMDYAISELSTERFESQFVNIPFPEIFKRGMPVRLVASGEYGIIAQGSEMWDDFIEKFGDGKTLDYIDMSLTVVFITEDGMWSHEHINPIYLEVEMPKTKDNPELAYALEALSDYWSGSGSEEIVLKYSRQYADSKKKPRTVDLATTVQEIII